MSVSGTGDELRLREAALDLREEWLARREGRIAAREAEFGLESESRSPARTWRLRSVAGVVFGTWLVLAALLLGGTAAGSWAMAVTGLVLAVASAAFATHERRSSQ